MGRVHGELLHTLITITSVPTQFSTSTHNHDEVQHSRFRCYAPRSTSPLSSHRHQIRSAQGRMGKCRLSQGHRRESRALSSSSRRLGERRLSQGNWREPRAYPPPPKGDDDEKDDEPEFTSRYHITAVGAEVRNGTVSVPGPADAVGYYNYGINSKTERICWEITLLNVAGTYLSLARTATHIHEAARGASGPPRLAFPNPQGDDKKRVSTGCMTVPFTTGLNGPNGQDTGIGFKLAQIEANPAGFFTDAHTNLFPLGVVRGQLA